FVPVFIALKTAGMCCFTGADPAASWLSESCTKACYRTSNALRMRVLKHEGDAAATIPAAPQILQAADRCSKGVGLRRWPAPGIICLKFAKIQLRRSPEEGYNSGNVTRFNL